MRARLLTAVVAVHFLFSGCGTAPRAEVRAAPSFDLAALDGGRVSLESLRGKVVVLDFWATWCGPCIKEIPDYVAFSQRNKPRGVEVIGVVFDSGEPQEVQDFVSEHRIPYRQLVGTDDVQEAFGANHGFPTTFVLDAQGLIRTKMLGSPPEKFETLQKAVDAALAGRQ